MQNNQDKTSATAWLIKIGLADTARQARRQLWLLVVLALIIIGIVVLEAYRIGPLGEVGGSTQQTTETI